MASLTPAKTLPEELQRQSERVQEQLQCLKTILDNVENRLHSMSSMMENKNTDLSSQLSNLADHLENYESKAQAIYDDVSDSLSSYSVAILNSIESLNTHVTDIGNLIADL